MSDAASLHKVSRQSVQRWLRRYDGTLESLMDRSRRPTHQPVAHKPEKIALVLRLRRRNKRLRLVCLRMRLEMKFKYKRSPSAFYRLLKRLGPLPGPKRPPKGKPKLYEPILVPEERSSRPSIQ